MAENDPNNSGVNSGGTASSFGAGGTGTGMSSGGGMTTGSGGATGSGFGVTSGSDIDGGANPGNYASGSSGSMGSVSGGGSPSGDAGGTDTANCPHCGQTMAAGSGLESILNNLKSQFQNVDIDEYLNNARDMLKGSSTKATSYAKENPGKVAAGVAALALGAGLIYAAVNRDRNVEIEVVDGEAERDDTGNDRGNRS